MTKNQAKKESALIIRFSSFGDIVQSSFVAQALLNEGVDTHLLTKSEFSTAFKSFSIFKNIISFDKKTGASGLFKIAKNINNENYKIIYDAHNNQRTLLLKTFLFFLNPFNFFKFKTRSKFRIKRFLLFKLRINLFPKPFKGASSFLEPLNLKLDTSLKKSPESFNDQKTILFAPSAAWDLKKWPVNYWIDLANSLKDESDFDIELIGGPDDHFIKDIQKNAPQTVNLAGKLSWADTIEKIKSSQLLISGDTGVLHIADYFGVKALALMGPSAFGYPYRDSSKVISLKLPCQPCTKDGRGKCKIKDTKRCLTGITPSMIKAIIKQEFKK